MLKLACIPAFNEEKPIVDVIKKSLNYVDKVIVYDDGSSDLTSESAKNAGAIVIKHDKNMGKGYAMKSLFKYARDANADVVVTIDGDGQFLPEQIESLIKPILENNYDIVIGNRFSDDKEMPSYRKAGNKMLDKITKLAADLPFSDTQSGFRSYSKKAIQSISFSTNGFGVDSEILIDAVDKGLKITERNVTVIYNTGEKTSTKDPVSHSMSVVASLLESIAIHHPLKYLGIPGMILLIIGLGFATYAISNFNETGNFSLPSILTAMGSLIIGLILLLMSVVLYSIATTRKL
ncbi:glycosyltransferase family 2 protein [Nitrosopumilus ureiphilus]|uniref:Glycosyltransferase family 2 protein n=1 Tax=Nitrosopumilus ureiphilus TaxID=1470067 RepID=A0A7D5M304_9ARCH|nr:glycosyltransferase family 2 protein [Nitrosopumilus ureiphilus]QLH05814.1 glycosyltransferase family 2 protein [Nitrosopumilus ureiphilus]